VEWQSFDQRPLLGLEWTVVDAVVVVAAVAVAAAAAAVVDQRSRLVQWKSGVVVAVAAGVVAVGVNWCRGCYLQELI